MALVIQQPSLSAGEITPSLFGRVDIDAYRLGLAHASNFFVNYHGGLKNRSGFRFIGQAKRNDEVVLIPFSFSTIQTYMLEFGENYIRFISNGGYVLDGLVPLEVATPYLASELSRLTYTQSADVLTLFHKNHPIQELKRFSATSWFLDVFVNSGGPFETTNINQAQTIYADNQSGTVNLIANFSAFNDNIVDKLLFLDQQTSGEVRHWMQRMNVEVDDLTYYAGNYYQCIEAPFLNNEKAQTGDTPPTHLEGDIWDGPGEVVPDDNRDAAIGVLWRYVHSGFGIVRVDSYSDAQNAIGTVINTLPETVVGGTVTGIDWDFANETSNQVYLLDTPSAPTSDFTSDFEVILTNNDDASTISLSYPAQWTINFLTDTVTLSAAPTSYFTPTPISDVDVKISQKASIRETYKWSFEPWREDSQYPQCGTYYQQRLTVASSLFLPQTIWMSRTDSFVDFSKNRPLLADDTMRFDVNSLQVNEIFHMLPLNALLAFTAGGVWSINQGSNDVITPENPPSVRIQSYDGSSPLRPIVTGSTGLYVQDGDQIIRDIGFDFSNDAFIGIDLTVRAQHMFEGRTIVSWCYAKNPYKTIWVAFSDGEFAVFTYLKEQQIWGWCRGETLGQVISFNSIREGSQDAVYAVVKRDGVNFVERLSDRFFSDPKDQFFVDSGLTYDGRNNSQIEISVSGAVEYTHPNTATLTASDNYFTSEMVGQSIIFFTENQKTPVLITSFTSPTSVVGEIQRIVPEEIRNTPTTEWGLGANEFTGLDHLEGKTVSVMADAGDEGDFIVTGGKVEIAFDATVVHIGLPYTSSLQTLDIELSASGETARPNKKNINKVFTYTRSTTGIKAGTKMDNLNPYKAREDENYGEAPTRRTELLEIDVEGQWERPGRIYLVQDRPIETEILSIMPEVSVSEYN